MNDWNCAVEANLHSISVDSRKKEILIEISLPDDGGEAAIVAKGVDDFLVNEMRLSNVIDRIKVMEYAEADAPETVKRLLFMLGGNLPKIDSGWPGLQSRLMSIRAGKLSLLEIEPVYGANILVLAKEFQLARVAGPAGL